MRKISVLALALALGACGGSSDSSPKPAGVSGTIMGSPFTPADGGALAVPPFTCVPVAGTRSIAVLAMGFSSFSNVCGFAQTAALCGDVMSSLLVTATILTSPATGTASPVGPGTYAIGTFADGSGNLTQAGADITKVDGTCLPAAAIPTVSSGTITVASVSPRVSGSLDLTFSDGSRFAGAFDLAACSATVDFCAIMSGTCATTHCCTSATVCP